MPALDRLWRCASASRCPHALSCHRNSDGLARAAPTNQFNEVYRHGKFETCGKSVSELFTCFHAKFVVSREPERAQKMMDDAIANAGAFTAMGLKAGGVGLGRVRPVIHDQLTSTLLSNSSPTRRDPARECHRRHLLTKRRPFFSDGVRLLVFASPWLC